MRSLVKCFFDNSHKIYPMKLMNHYLRHHNSEYLKYQDNKLICEKDQTKLFKNYAEKLKHECKCKDCRDKNKDYHENSCEFCKILKNEQKEDIKINDSLEISVSGYDILEKKCKEEEKIDLKLPIFDLSRFKKNKTINITDISDDED